MSHIEGQLDADLHDEDGEHRSTPVGTSGRLLERHERRISAHLAAHGELQALADEAEAGYDPAKIRQVDTGELRARQARQDETRRAAVREVAEEL